MRGLKFLALLFVPLLRQVAPFAGAWIEMVVGKNANVTSWSHPSRVRGLK